MGSQEALAGRKTCPARLSIGYTPISLKRLSQKSGRPYSCRLLPESRREFICLLFRFCLLLTSEENANEA
jgi:hypothetical protein